ncbi:MAG: cellulase family glycosylhydrolase, partial [Elusimicrobiota bacterium]
GLRDKAAEAVAVIRGIDRKAQAAQRAAPPAAAALERYRSWLAQRPSKNGSGGLYWRLAGLHAGLAGARQAGADGAGLRAAQISSDALKAARAMDKDLKSSVAALWARNDKSSAVHLDDFRKEAVAGLNRVGMLMGQGAAVQGKAQARRLAALVQGDKAPEQPKKTAHEGKPKSPRTALPAETKKAAASFERSEISQVPRSANAVKAEFSSDARGGLGGAVSDANEAARPAEARPSGPRAAAVDALRRARDAARRKARAAADLLGLGDRAARPIPRPLLRGVNLGGWLVLERWMTNGLFGDTQAVDEYTFMKTPGAAEIIERHHKTFITEEDFQWLQKHGINAVRIPVGYWIFGGEPPYVGALPHLDRAFALAAKYKMRVLLDLHGAPGSQNGKDHSGRAGKAEWYGRTDYQERTMRTLERLADRYGQKPELWGIEIMNEPMTGVSPARMSKLYWWTRDAVRALSERDKRRTQLVFSDAFVPWIWSGRINDERAVMDVHHYQCFLASDKKKTLSQHEAKAAGAAKQIARWQKDQPVIIGEWSLALDGDSLGVPESEALPRYAKAQLDAFSSAAGWFYWSYKTEGIGAWNFRYLVDAGILKL